AVPDAGFRLREAPAAGVQGDVVRLPRNFTARRNAGAPYARQGRPPKCGALMRPLERTYKDRPLAAIPPDQEVTWVEEGREYRAQIWDNPVLPGVVPGPQQATFRVIAIYDPRYD
ncbi:MAG TPA: hypothetical protein G4O04_03615, partial [Anaerolineae bacterium]|nr:hypothetical protein [Anaerolineae bacterium]